MFGFQLRLGRPFARAPLAASFDAMVDGLFRNGEQGWAYDNNDLSTLFQDAAGTTPVTGPNQPVGLQLDKSRGLVPGPELVANGTFESSTTGWTATLGGPMSAVDGRLSITAGSTGCRATTTLALVPGRSYRLLVTLFGVTSNGVVRIGTASDGSPSGIVYNSILETNGAKHIVFTASAATMYLSVGATITSGSVQFDNISVRELPGNHRFQANAASRPILRQNATTGAYYLETDGSDDWMVTNSINFTGTDKVTLFTGVRKLSDAAVGCIAELSASSGINNGTFALFAPHNAGSASYEFRSRGSAFASAIGSAFSAPDTAVLSGAGDVAGDVSRLRRNGVQSALATTDQGAGNYGTYPAYFFRRGGTSLPFNGHEYSSICVGRLCTAAEIVAVERLLAQRTGVTLA